MAHADELAWLEDSVGVLALDDRAIISVGGDDARDWLQGQITNQLEQVEPGSSVYGFVLTSKGRVMADVYVLVQEGELWLDVPATEVAALLERFDRYIIMEDVDLEHQNGLHLITAQGPRSNELRADGWPADRLGRGGRQWLVKDAELEAERTSLVARARELGGGAIGSEAWARAHVLRGRPRFGVDFGAWTYPQESGLNPVAVSFNKGCYIGQETVVMLENRGKPPKVLWRWAIEGSVAPSAKTSITLNNVVVGEVTSAAVGQDGVRALGFLKRGHESEPAGSFAIAGLPARALSPVDAGPGVCGDQR
jgi:folate-binding protein YgfZ